MPRDISRRRFIQLSAGAWPGAASWTAAAQRGPAPVVIVGAGLAGMRAADVLRQAGRPVIVLEAQARAGGRVVTVRTGFDEGLYGEAGPLRIAGAHRTVLRLARAYKLTLTPFATSQGEATIAMDGEIAPAGDPSKGGLSLNLKPAERGVHPGTLLDRYVGSLPGELSDPAVGGAAYAKWQQYDRVTWPEWLKSRGASPDAIRLMTLGGDSRDLSALYVLRQFAMLRGSTQRYKIQGGMDLLPRAMAASLGAIVRYGAAVVRVTREASAFRLEYQLDGAMQSVTASHVIFAVPLPVLRQIEMRPRLSRVKEQAIDALAYYPGVRFLLQSRTRFWQEAGQSGSARTDRATEIWDSTYDSLGRRRGILGVATGGTIGTDVAALGSQAAAVKFGVALAADAFPAIRSEFEKGVVRQWATDRWSRGAFAVFRPGQMSAIMPEIARPEDGLHFAGEHTSSWTAWMEGALQSGERAAHEILGATPRSTIGGL